MKLKTYMCRSMNEAMAQIRAELGPDAVILSSLNEGDLIRVTAACEKAPPVVEAPQKVSPRFTPLETKNLLCQILSYHSVPTAVSQSLIAQACQTPDRILEEGLGAVFQEHLSFSPLSFSPPAHQQHQIMLAGPVGVGKTVTLAKIASEFRLRNHPVELISADHLKAGAVEQIQAYAQALEVPLTLIQNATQLEKILADAKPGVTYLIDTPGTNPLNAGDMTHLTDYILAAKQAPYLVVSAGGDALEMQETAATYKDVGTTRFIMTRFDAAKRFGGLLTILHKECLEFAAMSCGPEIGSRLKEATSDNLYRVLKAYLPATSPDTLAEKTAEHLSLISQPSQPPASPRQPELPAWVKGYMEAKKA